MQIIKRKMTVEETNTDERYFTPNQGTVQASFNSDGKITLRTVADSINKDVIIVLSEKETRAIFTLFKQIKALGVQLPELPF